jgi:hypothetical protein
MPAAILVVHDDSTTPGAACGLAAGTGVGRGDIENNFRLECFQLRAARGDTGDPRRVRTSTALRRRTGSVRACKTSGLRVLFAARQQFAAEWKG